MFRGALTGKTWGSRLVPRQFHRPRHVCVSLGMLHVRCLECWHVNLGTLNEISCGRTAIHDRIAVSAEISKTESRTNIPLRINNGVLQLTQAN